MSTIIKAASAALVLAMSPVAGAQAHVTFEKSEAKAGAGYKAVLRVGHGCDGSPTTALSVTIPDGVVAVKPMPKPGWTLAVKDGAYATPATIHGKKIESGVRQIDWSGGKLEDGQYDEFVFVGQIAGAKPGATLYFPVVQTCENGENRWVQIPADGQSPHALKAPAAMLKIAAADDGHGAANHVAMQGPIKIEQAWSRATPGGSKIAAGYVRITNTGKTPDRLVSGSTDVSDKFEIHEMSMTNGIMKMRPLEKGIEIAPGQTVELKPGGNHFMFVDLKKPLQKGDSVKGTLVFDKAGKIDVTFQVQPIGAGAPGSNKPDMPEMDHSGHMSHGK